MKTISEIEKEFDDTFGGFHAGCDGCSASQKQMEEVKQFLIQSLRQLLEQVLPEDILICEQHSSNNDDDCNVCKIGKRCSNACRQQVEDKIKEILI